MLTLAKTQTVLGARNEKQINIHLEIISIVSQQHKSIAYNIHSMAEAAYIFSILKHQFMNHMYRSQAAI